MSHMKVEKDDVVMVKVFVREYDAETGLSLCPGFLPCQVLGATEDSVLVRVLTDPEAGTRVIRRDEMDP